MPGLRSGLLVAAWWVAVSHAWAASDPSIPIRAEVLGTSDCPVSEVFFGQVEERTSRARHARAGELAWSVKIMVKAVGNRRLAQLRLMSTEGEWLERELVAPNCRDALEALAVVLAVLVDTAVAQAESAAQRSDASERPTTEKPLALPRVAAGVYIPWIDDPDFFEKRGISLSPTRFIARAVGSAELDTQLASHPTVGLGLGFEVERWGPSMLRPSFGLSVGWATGDANDGPMIARLQRWSLRGQLCPFELYQGRSMTFRPCMRVEGGYVFAHTDAPVVPQNWRMDLLRISPYFRWTLALAAGAQLRLDAGVDLLAIRTDVQVVTVDNESHRLHTPPAVGAYLALAVAVEY